MPLSAAYLGRNVRGKSGALITAAQLVYEKFTNPTTADTDGLSVSHAGASAASTIGMTLGGALTAGGIGRFAIPRNVVITVTHATAVVAMSGVITGLDRNGNNVSEAWSVTAGTTTKTFTGAVAFSQIFSITETVAADASANTIIAGDGVKLGLVAFASVASLVKETSAGSVVTNGVLVAGSTAANADPRGTYAPNSAPNGSTTYEVWYISNTASQSP